MIRYFFHSGVAALLLFGTPAIAADASLLDAFDDAQPGMKRQVLFLPHKEREEEVNFRLELRAGKVYETDGVNQYRLGGQLEQRTLKGWGYRYYEYTGSEALVSTLMAAPEGAPKVRQFVAGAPLSIPYNSRVPVVIYLPEDMSAQYRVWSADSDYLMLEDD